MALPRGAMGLSAVSNLVCPDHTHLQCVIRLFQ